MKILEGEYGEYWNENTQCTASTINKSTDGKILKGMVSTLEHRR